MLIGRAERFDILNAAFVNAIAGNLFDFDDTHLATVIHPTAPVAPVVLALAEQPWRLGGGSCSSRWRSASRSSAGSATPSRPAHYARGWHITATCGVFGAAAAAAKLLGLSPAQTAPMRSASPPASRRAWSRT